MPVPRADHDRDLVLQAHLPHLSVLGAQNGACFVIHNACRAASPGMSKLVWRFRRVLIMFLDS
jgi:hypothetical protein